MKKKEIDSNKEQNLKYKLELNSLLSMARHTKILSITSLILDLGAVTSGLVYIFYPVYNILWDWLGAFFLTSVSNTILLVYSNNRHLRKKEPKGNKLNNLGLNFLGFSIISMLGMAVLNTIIFSRTYSIIWEIIGRTAIYLFYFGLLLHGILISIETLRLCENSPIWVEDLSETHDTFRDIVYSKILNSNITGRNILLKAVSFTTFIFGLGVCYIILVGTHGLNFGGDISQFALFLSIIFFSNTIIMLTITNKKTDPRKFYATAIIGLFITSVSLTPLILTASTQNQAEISFNQIFGNNWRNSISSDTNSHFLQKPFVTADYYLGRVYEKPEKILDVLYFDGFEIPFRISLDKKVKLFFDVYFPPNGGKDLPGMNSTLIRIHGGAWISGDKGASNMADMNEYFARQGYVVFDIQYGLFQNGSDDILDIPDLSKGEFTLDEMIYHIGIFTIFLEEHAEEYGANLDSVFFSGHSAGGHLATTVGLAITSGNYTDIFSTEMNVKGIIPFYPGYNLAGEYVPIITEEFVNPELLINELSPPCLIYHGTGDGQVLPEISESLKSTYIERNNDCILMIFPTAAHISDFFFTGYYNQIFLYYMERFMFLNQ